MTDPINMCMTYEQRTLDALTTPFILPVTIITGYLGSGKTTLLRKLLTQKKNLRIAALVNDLGDFNHDVQLLQLEKTVANSSSPSNHGFSQAAGLSPDKSNAPSDRIMDLHGSCLCCSHLQQEMRQNIWECLQTPEQEERAIDYLVIETSGVTDPERIIQALDEKFGKMTRARLDSVVTVVDADVLHAELVDSTPAVRDTRGATLSAHVPSASHPEIPPTRCRQIECADVIILNKTDLVKDLAYLDDLEAFLRKLNPLARIHRTRFADLPLPCVLDVELPDLGAGSMTHEESNALFATRKASTLRSEPSQAVSSRARKTDLLTGAATAASDQNARSHLVSEGISAFTFESKSPFLLRELQRFFSHVFPAEAVIRSKGFLYVRELAGRRVALSISGRRRFHLSDEGTWSSAPRTQVVFIGRLSVYQKSQIQTSLQNACKADDEETSFPLSDPHLASSSLAAQIRDMIALDKRMEVMDARAIFGPLLRQQLKRNYAGAAPHSLPSWVDCLVTFRLTGAPSLGVTADHLRLTHGVDLDALNLSLQEKVNMAGIQGRPLLYTLPLDGEERGIALCFVVEEGNTEDGKGRAYFSSTWEWITLLADSVVARNLSHLKLCKCGH